MAKGFSLQVLPFLYYANYGEDNTWSDTMFEQRHMTPEEESRLPESEQQALYAERNTLPVLPLVNYTSQYGMGCFEGMKAFPQPDGSMKLFRPDENAARMRRSMEGLKMPGIPEDLFLKGALDLVRKNMEIGFAPKYQTEWESNDFLEGHSIYLRPFSWSESAIGLGLSQHPSMIIVGTQVGSYFRPGNTKAITTTMIRAFPGGTGWIKCNANYVVPILAKKEAEKSGYMEAIFLDAEKHSYVEEGSSCNIFFYQKNGSLVTPELGDTILPGITRKSILTLAQDMGVKTEERAISIEEAMSESNEVFVTGTAAGLSYMESITHKGKTAVFNEGKMGELSHKLLQTLKGIQYGKVEDRHNWMHKV
jgi:branched-chain amino acid aminotransferase